MNIVDHIFQSCDREAMALVHGEETLTYGELESLLDEAAAALRGTGWFEPEESRALLTGLSCPNGFAHVLFSLAVLRCGGCLVPVPSELTHRERDALVESTGLDRLLTAEGQDWHREAKESRAIQAGTHGALVLRGVTAAEPAPPTYDEAALAAMNPALIRFSSGTTGQSKGVVLSHDTLLARVTACNSRLKIGPGDRVIWILPMAHHFAVSIVLYLLHGATTVIVDSHLAEDLYAAIRDQKGTVLYGSPFHHALLADYPEGRPLPALRVSVSTAAPLPKATAEAFQERYDLPITQGLGIIEVGLPLLNDEAAASDPLRVGRPQQGFEVTIRDESGTNLEAGKTGELLLRGPGMFDAYLSPWRKRDEVLDAGWFHTGDLGHQHEDGSVTLSGRLKSVINVAGMKVFAEEVEQTLCEHPAVKEARVCALPHPQVGQVPVAELVAADPENPPKKPAILSFCRERLSHYKVPMKISWVDALPKTASGKIKRA